jgi:hypothetical protein
MPKSNHSVEARTSYARTAPPLRGAAAAHAGRWASTMRIVFLFFVLLVLGARVYAGEMEYRPGGLKFNGAWEAFYVKADHEPEIDDPLIAKGRSMVPAICEAIRHKDMKRRRYAIGALGYIGDKGALPALESILADESEIDYFRGDALHSIYLIDRKLGLARASPYQSQTNTLGHYAKAVVRQKPWLLLPSKE